MREDIKNRGLTTKEAEERLLKHGYNVLPEKPPPSSLSIFISQFKNPLVYILLIAGLTTLYLKETSDTLIILFVVLVNSALGFFQEMKANNALTALKSLVQPSSTVARDGNESKIGSKFVVPGDIVALEHGEKIPADGRLIFANRLFVGEAILTGESVPVAKNIGDEVYMGTVVASGEAILEVVKTGSDTEMGKIALHVQEPREDTPLTKQLKFFSRQLTVIIVLLTTFVFITGLIKGIDQKEIFKTSVALAVSSIPEGLLIALTVVLSIGMQRILKNRGLVKDLLSAETLGGVTTICVDKTGTLTYGNLEMVQKVGDVEMICPKHFASSQDPIMVAAYTWLEKNSNHNTALKGEFNFECRKIDSIPFNARNRYYASLVEHKNREREIYVDGAPETLLEWSEIDPKLQESVLNIIEKATKEGKRVIGIASKKVGNDVNKISEKDVRSNLKWIGLFIFSDSVRESVGDAFSKTKEAGIKTILITGDYADTAISVIHQLKMKISKDRVIIGSDLEKLSDEQVASKLRKIYEKSNDTVLFARTRPEQKLKVINALKLNGEIVAMMGDGVNDAPALHKADIGVVVGEATDVAKESANLILLDSSFSTIVAAIREGRGIFDNIRKIILYLMSDSFEEIVAVVGTIILSLPLPVTAVQILWINIVSDGFPHLSLTVDPKTKDIMVIPPVKPGTNLISGWMKVLILVVSVIGGLVSLFLFWHYYTTTGNEILARSVAFAALGMNSLVYVFSIRTLKEPFWKEDPFVNKWLNLAVFAGLAFQIIPFTTQVSRDFFKIEPLDFGQWLSVILSSLVMFFTIELSKLVFNLRVFSK